MSLLTKLFGWLRAPGPEAEADAQRLRAEHELEREQQLGVMGPRGIGEWNPPSTSDRTDPRR
jgi:hypothetical protein